MLKKLYTSINNGELVYSIPGYLYFLYILFPFRFWKPFIFSNQIETIVITVFFAYIMFLFSLFKLYQKVTFQFSIIDILLIIYGIYLLCRLRYPVEKEYFFIAFAIVCIFLYFRKFTDNYLMGLLLLMPIAGVIQIVYGINQFTMPWQNISHITGIFHNTGLFGCFVALGTIVCVAMFFLPVSGKWYFKFIVLAILIIPLTIQVYASGSRASWLAVISVIFFLFYRLLPKYEIYSNYARLRLFLVLCLLVLFVPFSKHLYDLKKNSTDGRILIGKVSLKMVKDAPVFGSDISGFRAGYMNRQADYFQSHPDSPYSIYADDVESPFNEFLKILIEQGIIGFLLFACLLYYLFNEKNSKYFIHKSIILFILIFGFFSYPFDKIPFVMLFVFSLAILSQGRNPVLTLQLKKISSLRIILIIALCLVSLIIVRDAYSYSKCCRTWNSALEYFAYDKEKSLSQLKKVYIKMENNPVFLTTYGKALNLGGHSMEATVVLERAVKRLPLSLSYIELGKSYEAAGFPEKALACWKHAGLMRPSLFAPLYLIMKLYFKNGNYGKAKEFAKQLLTKKIKIDNPEIDGMKHEAMEILNFHLHPD